MSESPVQVVFKVRMSADLIQAMADADNDKYVTVEWGEPDAEGFYEPVFTSHYARSLLRDTDEDRERLWQLIETRWPHHIEGTGGTGDATHRSWDVIDPAIPTREWFDLLIAALRGQEKAT